MDSEIKFREFFRVSRDIFHLILTEIKEDITRSCNRWQKEMPTFEHIKSGTNFESISVVGKGSGLAVSSCRRS
jgi:hypothetical protein